MSTESGAFVISRMSRDQSLMTSALIVRTISSLEYYNDRAKEEELAKYSSHALEALVSEDPDAVLVATDGVGIVGFCVSRYDDGLVWLSWFGVDDSHRGQGIGTDLLKRLAATLKHRRAHKIWCDTRTANETSGHVLARAGFSRITELKNHWYGQDFYLWEWVPS